MNRLGRLSEADLWPLRDAGNALDSPWCPILRENDRLLDVMHGPDQAYFPNVDLLLASFDKATACIGIAVGELLLHLREAEPVGNQLVGVQAHLVFAGWSAKTGNVD